jgi:ABC-type branched-subunit amino acid transport system substrate-binding protein
MQNRSSKPKRPRDFNSLAFQVVAELTGTAETPEEEPRDPLRAAAAELGRRGGLKGGKARAEKLTPEQRRTIAQNAARQRWSKKTPPLEE